MRTLEGAIYTVDDVSDLLGIPRPTLYRYLREYSIPHLRQGGRIRIPEDSFDRIREARDLHKEGLVTETVRRQLREGGGPDTGELDRRLNKLHDTLEDLRGDLRARPATGEVALSPALQTILARQSLMLSAMFNLTGMVEHLLLNNSKTRKRPVARVEGGLAPAVPLYSEERGQLPATLVAEPVAVREVEAPEIAPPAQNIPTGFGSLGRRRRRGALAVLTALLLGLLLFFFLPSPNGGERTSDGSAANGPVEQQKSPEERPAGADAQRADAEGGGEQANAPVAAPERTPAENTTAEQEGDEAATAAREAGGGVPDVSGSSLEEAAKTLSEAGHGVAAIRSVRSQEEPGTVTGTEPPAGAETGGAAVVLTVSAGPTGASSANVAAAGSSATSSSSSGATSVAASSASAPSTSASASASASPSRRQVAGRER